jgi:hypothetical protein
MRFGGQRRRRDAAGDAPRFTATAAIAVTLYDLAALSFWAPISPARGRRP